MNLRHSKAYRELALAAGRQAGLKKPTPETVAEDETAREIRDALWAEYEARLRDRKTYTIRAICEWLIETLGLGNAPRAKRPSLSAVDRDRRAVLAQERRLTLSAQKTRQILEATKETDEADVFEAVRKLIGQHLFEFFLGLPADAIQSAETGEIIRLMKAAGQIGKAHAETEILNRRLVEMREAVKAEVTKRSAKAKDGRLSREDVYALLDRIMKGEAA